MPARTTLMGKMTGDLDPLALALEPPAGETDAERWAREQQEAHARAVSAQIDDALRAERNALKKKKKPVKVLVLGQSESGKSTTVKNFQIAYAYSSFVQERNAWRAVVHLNLVRSINAILGVVAAELGDSPERKHPDEAFTVSDSLKGVLERLEQLRSVQSSLERQLGAASTDAPTEGTGGVAAPWKEREFGVRSRSGWRGVLDRVRKGGLEKDEARSQAAPKPRKSRVVLKDEDLESSLDDDPHHVELDLQEIAQVIELCADDMQALWSDGDIQALLTRRGMRPEEGPGFFLDDIKRVARREYEPTDGDVVRARLRTLGVQEYRFVFEKGAEAGHEWWIYDVGGARNMRHAWYPYFDDINAIIFLAPISCFDEGLVEDQDVPRLQDSITLWKAVCSSKILAHVQLILFLNKWDLLTRKLERGVRFADNVPSYGDKPNDARSVSLFIRDVFQDILTHHSPKPRTFYWYLTCVVDTGATAVTVAAVRDGIQRAYLENAKIL